MSCAVCFIGNSHLVPFKLAWDEIGRDYPDYQIDTFGSSLNTLRQTKYSDGKIIPTSGLVAHNFVMTSAKDDIALDAYDIFCITACGIDFGAVVDRLSVHYLTESNTSGTYLVSSQSFVAAIVDVMRETLAADIYRMIRQTSSAPVYFFPQPFTSELALTYKHPRGRYDFLRTLVENGDDELVNRLFSEACAVFSAELGGSVVHQPDHTRTRTILTKRPYGENAPRMLPGFTATHTKIDCNHMNASYGIAVLKNFLEERLET